MASVGNSRGLGYERRERVSDLLLREIALIISEGNIRDTRVSLAVITHVSLSRDMSSARVFFTSLKGNPPDSMVKAFDNLSGFFRKQIATRLNLKKIPSIEFKPDDVLHSAHRLDDIIRQGGS